MKTLKALFLFAAISLPAQAGLIQWDAFEAGDNAAVKDTETDLVWLDLSQTAGVDYYNVLEDLSGWTYATTSQVESLVTSFFDKVFVQSGSFEVGSQRRFGEYANFQEACYSSAAFHSEKDLIDHHGEAYTHDRAKTDPTCYQNAAEWGRLFGVTQQSTQAFYNQYSFGLYGDDVADDSGFKRLRMAGAYLNGSYKANIYGVDYKPLHNEINSTDNGYLYSSFLVKLPEVKPDPIAIKEPEVLLTSTINIAAESFSPSASLPAAQPFSLLLSPSPIQSTSLNSEAVDVNSPYALGLLLIGILAIGVRRKSA